MKINLSVVLATRNEEVNIGRCLTSVKNIADEIIVVDEYSTDKTVEIAKTFDAKIFLEPHHDIFHITKQKALDNAKGEWILQLDADEVVTLELAKEIKLVISHKPLAISDEKRKLFDRHQKLLGTIGKQTGEIVGYFIPRRNIFLEKPLIHAGVYPDPAIRLVKNGKARFPMKSVHEIMEIDGKVGWLSGDLLHYDSPTLERYIWRLNRYTDLQSKELSDQKIQKNLWSFLLFTVYRPLFTFCSLYFRHKGFLDGTNGFLWSFFSASHFPIAYFKYVMDNKNYDSKK
jgi:glycosyltransferase involved in cell wall biosynthesis